MKILPLDGRFSSLTVPLGFDGYALVCRDLRHIQRINPDTSAIGNRLVVLGGADLRCCCGNVLVEGGFLLWSRKSIPRLVAVFRILQHRISCLGYRYLSSFFKVVCLSDGPNNLTLLVSGVEMVKFPIFVIDRTLTLNPIGTDLDVRNPFPGLDSCRACWFLNLPAEKDSTLDGKSIGKTHRLRVRVSGFGIFLGINGCPILSVVRRHSLICIQGGLKFDRSPVPANPIGVISSPILLQSCCLNPIGCGVRILLVPRVRRPCQRGIRVRD